jgi:type VI secretion system protein ImpE
MSAKEALADGRLTDAIGLQQQAVAADPSPSARLFLFELLVLADRVQAAREQLTAITSDDPIWPATRKQFTRLLSCIVQRNHLRRRPQFLFDPPAHAKRRWNAARAVEAGDPDRGVRWVDRADAATPEVRGFVDGREFVGLRDGDERFASLFEVFAEGRYLWVPFEQVRAVVLHPAAGVLDIAYRPAELRLTDGRQLDVVLPLVYPLSAESGDDFALGEAVDWTTEGAGPVCAFGAKVYFLGEEELPLGQVRMLEIRSA